MLAYILILIVLVLMGLFAGLFAILSPIVFGLLLEKINATIRSTQDTRTTASVMRKTHFMLGIAAFSKSSFTFHDFDIACWNVGIFFFVYMFARMGTISDVHTLSRGWEKWE